MERIPVIMCIDVEPDRRVIARHRPDPLLGFEKLLTLVPDLRDRLADIVGGPVHFTWFMRMDPQIADAYGSATALAETYERELAELQRAGDEIGLHPHNWRWRGQWIGDHADAGWVEHCVDVALRSYREAFDRPCLAYRHGDRFMSNALSRQLDRAGIVADLGVEPGLAATRKLAPTEETTGWLPDTRTVPTHAYRPSPDDFRTPDPQRTSGLILVPMTPGVALSSVTVGNRIVPTGTYETLVPWTAPHRFQDMLRFRLAAPGLTHLAFAIRSDVALLADDWAAVDANLVELARQMDDCQQWHTASAAGEQLGGALAHLGDSAATGLEGARAHQWLHGRDDPGFREGIELDTLDLADPAVAPQALHARPLLVSAILPVFDAGDHLVEAVESVIGQTEPPDELIVVDDGSAHGTALEFLDGISAPFPIRIVRQPNAGQSAARNRGARAARGGLLAFLDQDDLWHPRHLATLCQAMIDEPDVCWSYSDFSEIDLDGQLVTRSFLRERGIEHPKQDLGACIAHDLMVVPSASVVRRAAFDALGGFDEALRGYEDDDLYVRAFRSGWRFAFHGEPLTAFRVHEASDSASARFTDSRLRFSEKLRETVPDDRRTNRYYFRDLVAPRFFDTSLDDYVRAVSERNWGSARRAQDALRHFGRLRRHRRRLRLAATRNPRLFRVLLRMNNALPRRLRVTRNPAIRIR
jgi:glycosyltransferase involved in cell wall biosynthesis